MVHVPVLFALCFLYVLCEGTSNHSRLPPHSVHAFMYLWYGIPGDYDDTYLHWDHEVLPHWEEHINQAYPEVGTRFSPPEGLHSPYYPLYGPYSSRDGIVLNRQFDEMTEHGIDVAVLSWWGQRDKPYATDTQGVNTDRLLEEVLQAADRHGRIRIAFHLEPYPGRKVETVKDDITYIIDNYGHHECLLRTLDEEPLLVFYVYDSYHIHANYWNRLLSQEGDLTIRNSEYDAFMIGLWLHPQHGRDIKDGCFDGFYTYFGSDGFSYGSTSSNWVSMCRFAMKNNLYCGVSVGPGYNDSLIRPWNDHNSRSRADGAYYSNGWTRAIQSHPHIISVTSYNEWGEGTQIEPARSYYLDREDKRRRRVMSRMSNSKKTEIKLNQVSPEGSEGATEDGDAGEGGGGEVGSQGVGDYYRDRFSGIGGYDDPETDIARQSVYDDEGLLTTHMYREVSEMDDRYVGYGKRGYIDYGNEGPYEYLKLTLEYSNRYKEIEKGKEIEKEMEIEEEMEIEKEEL